MSTRCNVVIRDRYGAKVWFYRHSDGYPSVTGNSVRRFLKWIIEDRIRDSVEQASGWLVLLGAIEYQTLSAELFQPFDPARKSWERQTPEAGKLFSPPSDGWKCGAYEPSSCGRHGDIEYLYVVDVSAKTMTCYATPNGDDPNRDVKIFTVDASNITEELSD